MILTEELQAACRALDEACQGPSGEGYVLLLGNTDTRGLTQAGLYRREPTKSLSQIETSYGLGSTVRLPRQVAKAIAGNLHTWTMFGIGKAGPYDPDLADQQELLYGLELLRRSSLSLQAAA